jgi:hypothetical protein
MGCLSLGLIENVLILIVVLAVVVGLVKLLLPLVLGPLGVAGTTIVAALNLIIWGIVAIFVIVLVFDLVSCFLGVGLHLGRS